MAHRLSKITTRTGDAGETGLADGARLPKEHARIRAIGDVDELNSSIGVLLAEDLPETLRRALEAVQHDLFDLGGELSMPGRTVVSHEHVSRLEALIEEHNAALPPLREFILPGGSRAAAAAQLARAVCRRAERSLVALGRDEAVGTAASQYLNRLSDLLFIAGRVLNRHAGRGDVQWRHERKRP